MPLQAEEIKNRICNHIKDAKVELVDLAGDNDHWQVTVTSASFKDVSRVKQHKAVYDAIGGDMGTTLHALSVKTKVS